MVWGVQVRVRLLTVVVGLTPGRDDATDAVQLGGLIGFRRLRPTARWRIARAQAYDDKGGLLTPGMEPFSPQNGVLHAPLLVPEFCSPNMPPIEAVSGPDGVELMLPGGPVGNTA